MIILDTDVLSIVQRGRGAAFQILDARLAQEPSPIFATIVSFEEQMRGWLTQIARAGSMESQISAYSRLHMLVNDYMEYTILDFDLDAAHAFTRLRRARIRIGTMDLRIAAIALANSATLISRNISDFEKVPGLDVKDWTRDES